MSDKEYPRCWVFDINHRVYERDENNRCYGSPVWIKHWVEQKIVGETSRSWVTSYGKKIPKKGGKGIAFDWEEVEQSAWVKRNRFNIAKEVQFLGYEKLKKVAEIISYKGDK